MVGPRKMARAVRRKDTDLDSQSIPSQTAAPLVDEVLSHEQQSIARRRLDRPWSHGRSHGGAPDQGGHGLSVWNRTAVKADPLAPIGAEGATDQAAMAHCAPGFTLLP